MFVIILSAPKNIIQREITRQTLNAVAKTELKWAFIIGQTMPDIQVPTLITLLLIKNSKMQVLHKSASIS